MATASRRSTIVSRRLMMHLPSNGPHIAKGPLISYCLPCSGERCNNACSVSASTSAGSKRIFKSGVHFTWYHFGVSEFSNCSFTLAYQFPAQGTTLPPSRKSAPFATLSGSPSANNENSMMLLKVMSVQPLCFQLDTILCNEHLQFGILQPQQHVRSYPSAGFTRI